MADLDRSIRFYRDCLGFHVVADGRQIGLPAAFLAAGDYHHHIGLNRFESEGADPPPTGHTGLYHVAFVYPDREELGRAVQRLVDTGQPIDHATDHGATVSVYLEDPDGNGIELYYDRPRSVWFDDDGTPILRADRFDYDASDRSTSPNGAIEAHPDHHLRQAGRALTVELNRASSARAKPSDR